MWTEIAAATFASAAVLRVPVRLHSENGYQYDPDEIELAITPWTPAIFVNTPHNPTGAVASRRTLERIARPRKSAT